MSSKYSRSIDTPEEFLLLNSDLAIEASVALFSGALCYGAYIVFALLSLQILSRKPHPNRPIKILFWAILLLWCLFTVSDLFEAAGWIILLRWPRFNSSTISLQERQASASIAYLKLYRVMMIFHPIPYMAADAVPIWRAYVLWINMAACFSRSILEYFALEVHGLAFISPLLYPVQIAVSIITNGAATIAIGIRAWHHRELTKDLRRTSSNPVYILLVLVEAGVLLCIIQILNLTMNIMNSFFGYYSTSPCRLAAVVISIFGDTVIAAYPSLIIAVLSFRGSMLETPTNMSLGTLYHEEDIGSCPLNSLWQDLRLRRRAYLWFRDRGKKRPHNTFVP